MKNVSVQMLLAKYIASRELAATTEKNYRWVVSAFERWLGRESCLLDLKMRTTDYLAIRLRGGTIAGNPVRGNRTTAAGHRIIFNALARYAARRRLCKRFRIRPLRKPRIIPNAFLASEIARLVKHATPRQRAAILFTLDTGFRKSDTFALAKTAAQQNDRGEWQVSKVVNKTGELETRRLKAETVAACVAAQDPLDNRLIPTPRSSGSWAKAWYRLGRRSGVNVHRRGLQAIRRSGASYIKANGGNPKRYLGHKTDGLAEQYYIDPKIAPDLPDLPKLPDLDEPDAA